MDHTETQMCVYHTHFTLNNHFMAWNITPDTPLVRFAIIFEQKIDKKSTFGSTYFEISPLKKFSICLCPHGNILPPVERMLSKGDNCGRTG